MLCNKETPLGSYTGSCVLVVQKKSQKQREAVIWNVHDERCKLTFIRARVNITFLILTYEKAGCQVNLAQYIVSFQEKISRGG